MKKRFLLTALAPTLLLAACNTATPGPDPVLADTTVPTIALTAAPASVSAGSSVTLTATASDNVGVTSVKFYRGDTLLATDTAAPYEYTQATTAADAGTLGFKAVASDAAGNTASAAASVTVTGVSVPDTTKPSVDLKLTLISGRSYSAVATASDNVGVSKVEFYDNGTLTATSSAAPYSTTLTYADNLSGDHLIVAKAYDAAGNLAESSATLTLSSVTNPGNPGNPGPSDPLPLPPSVQLTLTPSLVTQPGDVAVEAVASSTAGIAQVEFFVDDRSVGVVKAAPYKAVIGNLTSAQNGTYTIRARATDSRGQVVDASQTLTVAIQQNLADDSPATATPIAVGQMLEGSIAGQPRDVDYYAFTASAGDMLKLTVKSSIFPGSTLDPYVTLLLPDGKTELERSDDGGSALDSQILFNAPVSGKYFIAVTSFKIHDDPAASDDLASNVYQLALTRR